MEYFFPQFIGEAVTACRCEPGATLIEFESGDAFIIYTTVKGMDDPDDLVGRTLTAVARQGDYVTCEFGARSIEIAQFGADPQMRLKLRDGEVVLEAPPTGETSAS